MKKTVTIDFDGVLQNKEVQDYVKFLHSQDVIVFVVTARFDALHLNKWYHNGTNNDLYAVTDACNIPIQNIFFTNKVKKGEYFQGVNVVVWHLDNSIKEVDSINAETYTLAILFDGNWKEKCNQLLNII